MTVITGTVLSMAQAHAAPPSPASLAIYYGYPSLVNGAKGDIEKAAAAFCIYDVVVFGDGLEFSDQQASRIAPGDPAEHQKVVHVIAAMKRRNPKIRVFGYVPLGDYQHLTDEEIQERIRLWKAMGVSGIFLDEGSYDFGILTRERQNRAVDYIHQQGLSAFMNGYFSDHIFGLENEPLYSKGKNKNSNHAAPLLDRRDLYLIESFQIREGAYDDPAQWQERMKKVLVYRKRYGTQLFAITTAGKQPFDAQKLNYGWWSAWLNDLDGFGWGEPNFSASDNSLPDHRCAMDASVLGRLNNKVGVVGTDQMRFWRRTGGAVVVLDTSKHTVKLVKSIAAPQAGNNLGTARQGSPLMCGAK
jgi:hypothetical protein